MFISRLVLDLLCFSWRAYYNRDRFLSSKRSIQMSCLFVRLEFYVFLSFFFFLPIVSILEFN